MQPSTPHLVTLLSATGPLLSERHVLWVAIGLGIIALAAVLLPLCLAWADQWRLKQASKELDKGSPPKSFFELPYITWFLIHYAIPVIAILAIVLLGIDDVIDKGTVSALLGSLFGYVLGSSAHGSPSGGGSTIQGAPTGKTGAPGPGQSAPPTTP